MWDPLKRPDTIAHHSTGMLSCHPKLESLPTKKGHFAIREQNHFVLLFSWRGNWTSGKRSIVGELIRRGRIARRRVSDGKR